MNVPIVLSLRVNDGNGCTERTDVEAFVNDRGNVVDSEGWSLPDTESHRPHNRREIERGTLQTKLNVLNEKCFKLNLGVGFFSKSSRAMIRESLLFRIRRFEKAIAKLTNRPRRLKVCDGCGEYLYAGGFTNTRGTYHNNDCAESHLTEIKHQCGNGN